MRYYVISDTHFNHAPIVEYCNRPEDHEERMLRSMTLAGAADHCLIHLGDLALGGEAEACARVCQHWVGRKVLVMGNHDSKSVSWYMEHGWDFVCESFRMEYCGKKIMFSHMPSPWDGVWDMNVHGHLHNLGHRGHEFRELKRWHRLYAPELFNYQPVELSKLVQTEPWAKEAAK